MLLVGECCVAAVTGAAAVWLHLELCFVAAAVGAAAAVGPYWELRYAVKGPCRLMLALLGWWQLLLLLELPEQQQ